MDGGRRGRGSEEEDFEQAMSLSELTSFPALPQFTRILAQTVQST